MTDSMKGASLKSLYYLSLENALFAALSRKLYLERFFEIQSDCVLTILELQDPDLLVSRSKEIQFDSLQDRMCAQATEMMSMYIK